MPFLEGAGPQANSANYIFLRGPPSFDSMTSSSKDLQVSYFTLVLMTVRNSCRDRNNVQRKRLPCQTCRGSPTLMGSVCRLHILEPLILTRLTNSLRFFVLYG